MKAPGRPVWFLKAEDVMSRGVVTLPRHTSLREAARFLRRAQPGGVVVVDDEGRFAGLLTAADYFRWVEDGCPEASLEKLGCPFQFKGRLFTGQEALICNLAGGSCPFQALRPTTTGRHTALCTLPPAEESPFGTPPCYVTTDVITARPETPLRTLRRSLSGAVVGCVVVVDEHDRPVGIVSATGVLDALARVRPRGPDDSGDPFE